MAPIGWKFKHDEDHFLIQVPIPVSPDTEHLKLLMNNTERALRLELWGPPVDGLLRTIDLHFRPIATAFAAEADHVIVQLQVPLSSAWRSFIAEVVVTDTERPVPAGIAAN